jgi:large subunit ribosomal protein L32
LLDRGGKKNYHILFAILWLRIVVACAGALCELMIWYGLILSVYCSRFEQHSTQDVITYDTERGIAYILYICICKKGIWRRLVMLPKRKISKQRTRKRRTHHALKPLNLASCSNCGHSKLPHAACNNCGYVNPRTKIQLQEVEEA